MSTRIDRTDRSGFWASITQLSGAAMQFHRNQAPLAVEEFATFTNDFSPQDYRDAVDTMRRYDMGGRYNWTHSSRELCVDLNAREALWVRYWHSTEPFLRWPHGCFEDVAKIGTVPEDKIIGRSGAEDCLMFPLEFVVGRFGEDNLMKLVDWGRNCVIAEKKVARTLFIFDEVMHMASTIGQLHRMIPELAKYAPRNLRLALDNQEKQSRLPPGWAEYDKTKVDELLGLLAEFHLLNTVIGDDGNGSRYSQVLGDSHGNWAQVVEKA